MQWVRFMAARPAAPIKETSRLAVAATVLKCPDIHWFQRLVVSTDITMLSWLAYVVDSVQLYERLTEWCEMRERSADCRSGNCRKGGTVLWRSVHVNMQRGFTWL